MSFINPFLIILIIFPLSLQAQQRMISPDGKITKGDFTRMIPKTCSRLGGVDCSKGADSDGSVVCLNGERDSLQKFSDECSSAKLSKVEESSKDGTHTVTIRNDAGIPAKNVKVYFERLDRTKTMLIGEETLTAFSLGMYKGREKRPYEELVITCENCGIQ